jgi:hypothetical protein
MLCFLKTINKTCMNHESLIALETKYLMWNILDPDNI